VNGEAHPGAAGQPSGVPNGRADDVPITVIQPRGAWGLVDLAELWRYRELLFFLVWRDVKVRYKQTVLGLAWAVVQPVATMLVFVLFLGHVARIAQGVEHYALYVFAGMVPWTFFSNAITGAGNSLIANERLVTKVYFPRLAVPLSNVGAALFDFGIAFILLVGMALWYGVVPGPGLLLVPVIALLLVVATSGFGVLLSALIVAQRDFRYVLTFGVQLWMFATPCIYLPPIDPVMQPRAAWTLPLNPAYGLILAFRQAVLNLPIDFYALGVSSAVGAVVLLAGMIYFRHVERSLADII
jgi:lipopolysaccharide transport system permease protein